MRWQRLIVLRSMPIMRSNLVLWGIVLQQAVDRCAFVEFLDILSFIPFGEDQITVLPSTASDASVQHTFSLLIQEGSSSGDQGCSDGLCILGV